MDLTILYQYFIDSGGVSIDTRTLQKGQLFFALKGENFNGNEYATQALEQGAAYAIIDETSHQKGEQYLLVDNVLETLQNLANYHSKQLKIPIIAITGSNGKTTTKELLRAVLNSTYKTFATHGNLNNHIGVPLSILSIEPDHEMAIIEMGANHLYEINQLCKIAEPNFGLITNIGKAHLEGFGSEKRVQEAKGELFEFLDAAGGRMFVNMNDFKIAEMAYYMQKVTTYGIGKFYDINGKATGNSAFLQVLWEPKKNKTEATEPAPILINTQLIGNYNLDNALAAIAIGVKFKVSREKIKEALESYVPKNNRSQIIEWNNDGGNNTIILDAYNANPSSMKAALENLASMEGEKKYAILGDMLELGPYSEKEHLGIIHQAEKMMLEKNLEKLILIGKEFASTSGEHLHFENKEEAAEWFEKQNFSNALILIKGSRGVALEKILKNLEGLTI